MKQAFVVVGSGLVLLALVLISAQSRILEVLLPTLANSLSPDGNITVASARRLQWLAWYLSILAILAGGVLIKCSDVKFRHRITALFKETPPGDSWLLKPTRLQGFSSMLGLTLAVLFVLFYSQKARFLAFLFVEDGVFETLSAIAFALAAFLMLKVAFQFGSKIRLISAGIGLVCLFIALEEISWGQRIFGWDTPVAFRSVNQQSETSFHNLDFLGGFFEALYLLPALLFVPILFSAVLQIRAKPLGRLAVLLPPVGLLFLALLIGTVALSIQGELLEELLAMFAILYAVHVRSHLASETIRTSTLEKSYARNPD